MRVLQLVLLYCTAMIFVMGCASEKMEQAPETSQQTSEAADAAAEEPSMETAAETAAAKEITLAVTGLT